LAALAGGALGILLVFVIPTVIGSLTIFYSVMSVSLFVPIVVGLHTRRAGVPEALAAIGVGASVLITVELAKRTGAAAWLDSPWFDRTLLGILASGVAFGVVYLIRWRDSQGAP
jgi:hypothetical protein